MCATTYLHKPFCSSHSLQGSFQAGKLLLHGFWTGFQAGLQGCLAADIHCEGLLQAWVLLQGLQLLYRGCSNIQQCQLACKAVVQQPQGCEAVADIGAALKGLGTSWSTKQARQVSCTETMQRAMH